jgi:hypothetical protein
MSGGASAFASYGMVPALVEYRGGGGFANTCGRDGKMRCIEAAEENSRLLRVVFFPFVPGVEVSVGRVLTSQPVWIKWV